MKYKYNYEYWPLVILVMEGNVTEEDEFEDFVKSFMKIYERNNKFKLLIDLQNIEKIPMKYLLKMGAFLIKIKPLNKKFLIGSSYICSKKGRYLLDFIFTLHKPVAPHKTSGSYEESLKFLVSLQ